MQDLIKLIERANQVGLDAFGIGEWRKEFLDSAHAIILAAAENTWQIQKADETWLLQIVVQ